MPPVRAHTDLSEPTLGEIFRRGRLAQGLTQKAVARAIGAPGSQSQISSFEKDIPHALSADRVEAYAELIGLDLEAIGYVDEVADTGSKTLALCPSAACPGNLSILRSPFGGLEDHLVAPRLSLDAGRFCRLCREVLIRRCDNERCGAPLEPGLFCGHCGEPYVEPPSDAELNHERRVEWVENHRRAGAAALRHLGLAPNPHGPHADPS